MNLHEIVIQSALSAPEALAVKGPEESITYAELDRRAHCFALEFVRLGVQCGDRVGIWLDKSIYAIAAMQGILRVGAIYVPLDPFSPVARIQTILRDCAVRVVVTTQKRADAIHENMEDLGDRECLCIEDLIFHKIWKDLAIREHEAIPPVAIEEDAIAYILYTSGSTGKPKGVCISHLNALSFITWAHGIVHAKSDDRFANHAPFHFDLSVLDLYVAFLAGATVILIPEGISYLPEGLVKFLLREKPTIWYSVPSVLTLMIEQGKLLEVEALSLRCILFAGELFPLKHFRRLYQRWPTIRFLNLYGPTETNVCTYYEVEEALDDLTQSLPIGKACSGTLVWAQKQNGVITRVGEEGELMVAGPTVMFGYWGQPPYEQGAYATGDLVRLQADGNYSYVGRRDRMMKVRGYRVEPGYIEAVLLEYPAIHDAAVVVAGKDVEVRLVAFIVLMKGVPEPSLLEIKRHCSCSLPRYMIVDVIHVLLALPLTRNGKIDYWSLTNMLTSTELVPKN